MRHADFLQLLEAALAANQPVYARRAAEHYLAECPGDLSVRLALAQACATSADMPAALQALEAITAADPEDHRAQRLMGKLLLASGKFSAAAEAFAAAHVGDGLPPPAVLHLPKWATAARTANLAERAGDWESAQRELRPTLVEQIEHPLPSLLYLSALWYSNQLELARPLAECFADRWPRAIAFKLCLAECLLNCGDAARGLELLHQAATLDSAGLVAARRWDETHPYRRLWNPPAPATLPGPLPASLIEYLGINRLPAAQTATQEPKSADRPQLPPRPPVVDQQAELSSIADRRPAEELLDIQSQLDALAARLPTAQRTARAGQRTSATPASHYLIISSYERLGQIYGAANRVSIDSALHTLAAAIHARTGLTAEVVYVDNAESLTAFGLHPVNAEKAWDIKLLIGELAASLNRRRESVKALLIVGGPDIIPFHHLPNPTDDADPDIPSDNPYATPDENYFVPEWPVGRLPTGADGDPTHLLRLVQLLIAAYRRPPESSSWLWRAWRRLCQIWPASSRRSNLGYSAGVWQAAAAAVYSVIGHPKEMFTSPPLNAERLSPKGLTPAQLSYFNLHGIEDGPEWYGQRPTEEDSASCEPEYPVALRPGDLRPNGIHRPAIVFSEACSGANILGKRVTDALCLRFLETGTLALAGSTKIAYGSIATPLIGADLLGRYFWENINAGLPAGEALRRAKLLLAQTMHSRQGYLDGEDQKTLISFVLYGDPLAVAPPAVRRNGIKSPPPTPRPLLSWPTMCVKSGQRADISPETAARIKTLVAKYLPGMGDANWRVTRTRADCNAGCPACAAGRKCPNAGRPKAASPIRQPQNTVVTLVKTVHVSARAHPAYARVTVDAGGQIVKLAVSR